jgi:hypothetical protein
MSVLTTATLRFSCLGAFVCLVGALAWHQTGATAPLPRPPEGTVTNGIYTNKYFDLSYPLPSGWTEGMAGPGPSHTAYYVLSALIPAGEQAGMILIAAQDNFFAAKAFSDPKAMAIEVGRAMSEIDGMTIDRQPSEVTIAGRPFSRVDYSGVGLFRATFITHIRCHLVSFNLTTNNPERLVALARSLNNLSDAGARAAGQLEPVCIKNQAGTENLLTRVDPPAIAPFMPIPVRVIIGADGSVKHVHVIRATAHQRDGIETALGQWKFKPPEMHGRVVEIETGLLIEFTPEGSVKYSPSDRVRQF